MERRRFLALGAAVGTGGLAGCAFRQSTESQIEAGPEITLEPVIEGLHFPVELSFLPNGERLVVERFGLIMRHTDDGLAERPFLDLRERMAKVEAEKGLLGLALHPNFAENRKLYVRYSAPLGEGMPEDYSHTGVLAEFRATQDLTGVEPNSERRLLEIPEPGAQHNAGDLSFGPDGYLYASLGDGQRTNLERDIDDSSWWYDQGQAAQNTEDNLLGSILRIDVDNPDGDRPYGIPPENPLVGDAGRDEYFAWGLRNPYRMSFDDGDLYVGDVGEHIRESVYLVEAGNNCGWPIIEGSSCSASTSIGHAVSENPAKAFNPKTWLAQTNRISPVKVCPPSSESSGRFTDPIVEYQRTGSRSVTGGVVYRGEEVPELQGQYIFGDFIVPAPIFALENPGEGDRPQPMQRLQATHTDNGRLQSGLLAFARDGDGEVYVLTTGFDEGTGLVRRITTPE
jgi:glucose/arabinose dehydrogenase